MFCIPWMPCMVAYGAYKAKEAAVGIKEGVKSGIEDMKDNYKHKKEKKEIETRHKNKQIQRKRDNKELAKKHKLNIVEYK